MEPDPVVCRFYDKDSAPLSTDAAISEILQHLQKKKTSAFVGEAAECMPGGGVSDPRFGSAYRRRGCFLGGSILGGSADMNQH